MRRAVKVLESDKLAWKAIPECQSNLCMAIENAEGVEDVAAIPGRIVKLWDKVKASEHPWFGASKHVAKAILTVMRHHPRIRAAMNIRYDEKFIEAAKKLGWRISFYDRREEPEEIKRIEGATIPWGIETAIRRIGAIPDMIYHLGDWGKEPMILIFGEDALSVVEKLRSLLREAEDAVDNHENP